MQKKTILHLIMHIIFCILLIYWFSNNSFIRPSTITHPFKEVVSAIVLLLTIYTNYLVLLPKIYYKNFHLRYIFISMLIVFLSGLAEFWLVESDISLCMKNNLSENIYTKYIHTVLFLIILRNGGFYFFFTMLGQNKYNREKAFAEKKTIIQKEGIISFFTCNKKQTTLKVSQIAYLYQNKNRTAIHTIDGKVSHTYSSLSAHKDSLGDKCLRINREVLVIYDNIVSYTHDSLLVIDNNNAHIKQFNFFKNKSYTIYSNLKQKLPHLEQKNNKIVKQNDTFEGISYQNDDKNKTNDGINELILEEIRKKEGIYVSHLAEIFKKKFSKSTLERKLKELREDGLIEFRGAKKNGGYYIV